MINLLQANKDLNVKIGEYQKTVTDKNKVIKELQVEVDKLNITAPKLLPDGRIKHGSGVFMASEFSDGIHRAKKLFNSGDYDEAYRIAEKLKEKNPDFGLAFFLLGTIDVQRGNVDKGKKILSTHYGLNCQMKTRFGHFIILASLRVEIRKID